MSEILVGDVVAKLRADVSQFNQAIADVLQRLQQLNQVNVQATTQQGQGQQSTNQLATAYVALAQSIAQQTQAYTQASQATLAYRQTQDQARQAAQATAQVMRTEAATALQAQRTAAQAATQATAQAHAQQLQNARTAAQAQLQVTKQLHTEQMQSARLAAQAQLQAAREAAAATRQASRDDTGGGLLQGALSVAGGIGIATGIGAIAGQLKDLAVQAVQAGTRMESLRATLSALGGGTAAGQQQFQFLVSTAKELGVAFEPLARGWRTLTAAATQAGLPLTEQQRLLTALATEGRRVGASSEELGRAIQAVGQMASKGVVSMEELRQQLGEAFPTAFAAAAKGMGLTTERLTEMVSTGTLQFVPFAKALRRGFEDIQAASGTMGETGQQAFNRLKTAWLELQDAVMKSGISSYLVTVIGNFKEAIEWTTKFLSARERAQGPTTAELGATPAQVQQRKELQDLLALAERERAAGSTMTPGMEKRIADTKEQLALLDATIRAKADEAAAQAKVTAEGRKTESTKERQLALDKQAYDAVVKFQQADAAFRERAARTPNILGDPKGTAEQQLTFAKERENAVRQQAETLNKVLDTKGEGTIAPPFAVQAIRDLDTATKRYGDTQDALKKKEQDAAAAAREKEAAAKRAAAALAAEVKAAETQALTLDATLERLQGLARRPDESPAAEAATRARSQYAAAIAEGEKALVELERSASLRTNRPEAVEQYKAVVAALREASDAQAKLASDEVLKHQIKPLEELAIKYGLVTTEITSQSDHVQELASKYGLATQEAIDLAEAERLAASFTGTERQAAAEKYLQTIRDTVEARQKIEAQVPRLEQEALASFGPGLAAVRGAGVTTDLERQLELLRTPREERVSTRARQQAERKGGTLTPEHEALLAQIREQERLNAIMDVAGQIGDAAAQHITDGLLSIIDGTQRVGEAFQQMAKSILDSFAQILLSESIRGLVRLGLGVLFGALGGGAAGAGASLGGAFFEGAAAAGGGGGGAYSTGVDAGAVQIATPAQGGAIVNKPTTILAGENPGMNPEYVVNTPQMKALMGAAMRAGPSAGGQAAGGGGVTIINVTSKQQAEQEAARERGMGRQVVMNYIMDDLAAGAGSRIGRGLRAGGH